MGWFVYKLGKIVVGKYVLKLGSNAISAVTPPPGAIMGVEITYEYRGIRIFIVNLGAQVIKFLHEGINLLNRLARSAI